MTRLVPKTANGELTVLPTVTRICANGRKSARTARSSVMETVHVGLDPEHAPDQPLKDDPAAGLAVKVTEPAMKSELHVAPQTIPDGLLETVPDPDLVTVSV